jgi:hypothetical protein
MHPPTWRVLDDNSRDVLRGRPLLSDLETLQNRIAEHIGKLGQAIWHRSADGRLIESDDRAAVKGDIQFPELPFSENWFGSNELDLLSGYIRWKSPQLLQLAGLTRATRERLEIYAAEQPEKVERYWRLYPEIHNKSLLNSARVKARIRNSN